MQSFNNVSFKESAVSEHRWYVFISPQPKSKTEEQFESLLHACFASSSWEYCPYSSPLQFFFDIFMYPCTIRTLISYKQHRFDQSHNRSQEDSGCMITWLKYIWNGLAAVRSITESDVFGTVVAPAHQPRHAVGIQGTIPFISPTRLFGSTTTIAVASILMPRIWITSPIWTDGTSIQSSVLIFFKISCSHYLFFYKKYWDLCGLY